MKNKKILSALSVLALGSLLAFYFFSAKNSTENKSATDTINDCGPQALHSLLSDLGIDSTVDKIKQLADTDEEGTTMLGLHKAAREFGVDPEGMRLSYDELCSYVQNGDKIIAFINGDHYVYVKKTHPDGIVYKDIEPGFQFARAQEWKRMWYEKSEDGEILPHGMCLVISFGDTY